MSSSCISQYCSSGCCNYYGYCPSSSGSSLQTQCYYWYYYFDFWWVYYVVGGIALLLIIIASIIGCIIRSRRRAQYSQNTVVIDGNVSPSYNQPQPQTGYNPGYNNGGNQNYQQANNAAYQMGAMTAGNGEQAYFGQPVYPNQSNTNDPGYNVY